MLSRTWPPHGQGGLAAAAADLAGALARSGAEVRVLTPGGATAAPAAGVCVEGVDAPPGRYSRAWWRGSLDAYDRLGTERFDIVLGVSAAANALASRPRTAGPVFVFQAHGTSAGEVVSKFRSGRPRAVAGAVRNLYWGAARDRAYRDYDAMVAVGEAVRRQLAAWPTRALVGDTPVHLIHNGVEALGFRFDSAVRARLRAGLGLSDTTPLVVFAGRLQADKGPQRALQAFALALRRRPDLHLAVLGNGPEAARLRRDVAALGLQARVHMAGHVPRGELAGWFSAADGLIFPTRRAEGLPLVVLEALACGLPVLTTPEGACDPELPCLRFEAGGLGGFADALSRLSTDQPRTSRLPGAFRLHHSAQAYLALFDQLLSTPARRWGRRLAA